MTPQSEPGTTFEQRYRTTRLLMRGQGIDTWLADDLTRGGEVVLRAIAAASVPPSVRHRLEHEVAALRGLWRPELTPPLHLGRQDDQLYLIGPFVRGTTLAEELARGPLPVHEAIAVGWAVLSALAEAHHRGVLHRDVKPSNVFLDERGQFTLTGFGLPRSGRIDVSIREQPLESVRYMSPEQVGLLDVDVDERSDLYSAGAVLFECLAGRPCFQGTTITEVLRQHLSVRPPGLRSLGVEVPRALDEAVLRLLRKDPRDRYQSATGVVADLEAIGAALAQKVADPAIAIGLKDRRRRLTEPAFVGRERELSTLETHMRRAREGAGALVLLEGESGEGKTRLLDEVADRSGRSAWVLHGQGTAAAAQRPYQELVRVAEGVVDATRLEPGLTEELGGRLGEHLDAARAALPELTQAFGPAGGTLGPEAFGETRTVEALVALLDALGTRDRPAMVLLDDCQWADELTLKVLRSWHERRAGRARYVLVVASFRAEEVPPEHPLRHLSGAPAVRMASLGPDEIRQLGTSMAGELPAEATQALVELSGGSPFMASAVLHGLVESGALVREPGGWRVDAPAMAGARSSGEAALILARRLELLPPDALRLLSVGAVLGREFDLDFAAALSGLPASRAVGVIDEARRRHLVWTRAQGTHCAFVHDKLREAVLRRLPEGERRRLHREAGLETRARDPARVFEIAYHFDAAGDPESALPYAVAAADQARAQYALELAEQQYRIAERGSKGADPATRERIAEGLGDVLVLRGRYDEAERAFEAAGELAQADHGRARIQGKLADVAFKRGDMRTASPQFERALRLLGNRVPRRSVTFALALLWELGVQLLHSLFPRLFLARRRGPIPEEQLLSLHLYSRLTHAYFFQRGRVPTAWGHLRGMNLAERYPPSLELAQAYSEHAPVMTMLPNFKRGIAYVRRSYDIRREKGDLWGQGQSLTFYGVVLYAASRFEEAIETLREAQRLLRRTGDVWQMNTARGHTAYSLYRLGRMAEAVDLAKRLFEESLKLGDVQLSGIMFGIWGKAAGGRLPDEPSRVERYRKVEDLSTLSEVMQGEAVRLLRQERPAQAAAVLERAHRMVKEAGLRQEYVAPIDPWLATALRLELERTPLYASERRRELLRRAIRAARSGLRTARKYRNNLPHALRERGLLYAAAGHPRRAVRLLDESLRLAQQQQARHERAQTLLARGRLGVELGLPRAAEQVAEAERELGEMESPLEALAPRAPGAEPVTISLAERFDQILVVGRQIASAITEDAVYAAVRNSALVLLRGERCVLLEAHADKAIPVPGERSLELNRALLERAIETCQPAVHGEAPPESALEGPEVAAARSALCAPILVRGRPAACMYVTHHLANLFGEEEQRLAKFIATLAGAALENAEGFTEIRALSDERARLAAEAQDAVRARDDFLLTASHELRTPLTPLALTVQSLQRAVREASPACVPPAELARRLETMARHVRRFERLITNLLDISRISAGRLELALEEVELGALTRDVLEQHRDDLAKAGCELSFRARGQSLGRWDRVRLEQMVGNLLSNAVKFGAGRPIEVEVDGEGETVRLTVRDHGIGIPPEDQSRIFERFERAVSVRHYGGLGLGLWITRQIAEALGGHISVASASGEGSTFTVELPRRVASAAPAVH